MGSKVDAGHKPRQEGSRRDDNGETTGEMSAQYLRQSQR